MMFSSLFKPLYAMLSEIQDQSSTVFDPVFYSTYREHSFEHSVSLSWGNFSLQKGSLLFPGAHPPHMDLCCRILSHKVSFQATQSLFKTVFFKQACSLALRRWLSSSASTFSEGACRTQWSAQSMHSFLLLPISLAFNVAHNCTAPEHFKR